MICVAAHLIAKEGHEEAVEALFREYIPLVEKRPGVVRFHLHRSRSDPQRFLLYELYDSYEALENHRADAEFAVWRSRIALLEESRQLEEFDTVVPAALSVSNRTGDNRVVLDANEVAEVPFPIPGATEGGVAAQLLNIDGNKGLVATIIHIVTGARIPAHYHKDGSEAHYVLDGDFYKNEVYCPPGTYLTHTANVVHGPHSSEQGCRVLTLQSAFVDSAAPDFHIAE